ncbi:MAG: CapA family protein [Bdellovibrionota bacterium]
MQRQLKFTNACNDMDSSKFTLGFVGDVLLHMPLQNQAFSHEEQFKILWKEVQGLISQVDFMYANLEGPAAANIKNSSYPLFNYPEFILDNLVDSSFDIVSTVNNHTLDKGVLGVDRTIEGLRRVGLPYFGSIKSDEIEESQFYTITNISNGSDSIRVAWVSCTFSNNGNNDPLKQILYCFRQNGGGGGPNPLLLNLVENLHNMESIDAIIVTPHWGVEYVQRPNRSQSELAEQLIGAGALAVIGSHPHVLQPWEKIINNGREGFVLYSLGNFVSNQSQIPRRASIILFLGLRKTSLGKVLIDGISYFPMYMRRRSDESNQNGYHYLTPLNTAELVDNIGSMARENIYSIFPESYAIKNKESIVINGSQCH